MNKSKFNNELTKLGTVEEMRQRYRLSRNTLMDIAKDAGAIRKFGKSVRIDVPTMDKAIESYR